ncbi:hypothetical protein D3C78_1459010 [compost metagenome]
MPKILRRVKFSATAWPPLSRTMPLGLPVVPEVYMMYSGSPLTSSTGSTGCARATVSRQSRSRPACSSAIACGRCSTSTCAGLCCASSSALSTSGLYSITRSNSRPQDAVSTSFGLASSMRSASS